MSPPNPKDQTKHEQLTKTQWLLLDTQKRLERDFPYKAYLLCG